MTNFWLFLGRFHPLIVHLPIGFLMLAILMEFLNLLTFFKGKLIKEIQFSLALGTLSAIAAVVLGLLLAQDGEYNAKTLVIHKWMGIGVCFVSLVYFFLRSNLLVKNSVNSGVYIFFGVVIMILLSVTGHKGGDMTHGETYLFQYAPEPIKSLFIEEVSND